MADFENLCVCTVVINVTTVATTEQLNYTFVLKFYKLYVHIAILLRILFYFMANYTEAIIY